MLIIYYEYATKVHKQKAKVRRGNTRKFVIYTITSFPPVETHTKQIIKFVSYFYLWDCFGIIIDYKRPRLENPSRLNWINLQRDKNGNWVKTKK